ncbi:Phloem protein 2-like protein [Artemisia annua]|uniref:Phloem protein 2-like protein n=1 Tax=Artemisia annua TaxID=35608 RepID=A0A2U1Q523_ARTAN|nr:Phloem protein 2-like protein [Artemisia annua]
MQKDEDNSKMENLKHLKIPFKEIYSATRGFDDMIGSGGFGGVYRAELFHVDVRKYVGKKESRVEPYGYPRRNGQVALKRREIMSDQGSEQFWKEIDVLSGLNHQNIISLVGFCYEYGEMIIIYDYASNGSFEKYIRNAQNLKWEQCLQICIDAAQGLNYLHNQHIIHRDVKSPNILLGSGWEGIIGDVGLSITIDSADSQLIVNLAGTPGYIDPEYLKRGKLTKQSDMYSFGVVLLEVLRGRFARPSVTGKDRASLVDTAECHLSNNQPSEIIGDYLKNDLKNEKFLNSIKTFAEITHKCLHSTDGDETHRLTMADVLKGLKKALTVHVQDKYHKRSDKQSSRPSKLYNKLTGVAVKRLDRAHSYEEGAFLKELVKLSGYVHENIITLRGFCEEDNEKIIIMDHASNGSLDKHLDKSILTWRIRLKISIGAAKGLNHIHSFEEDQSTVHGDIKSNHILLDHDWKATISDFIISKRLGTVGYLDPQYSSSGPTKASDVYSFGVVLFELLSGRLAIEKVKKYSHPTLRQIIDEGDGVKDVFLAWMAARCFEENKLEALIFDDIKEQTDEKSIDLVSKVAYQCLHKDQEKRPTMALVIQKLEKAYNIHVDWEFEQKLPKDNENIMKMIEQRRSKEITKKDLYPIFSSGIHLNNGKVWLSLSEDGKVKEMISATMFSYENCWSSKLKALENSRFEEVVELQRHKAFGIKCDIETKMLSPDTTYACYLVFQLPENSEGLKCPVKARDLLKKNNKEDIVIYLRAPAPIDLYRDKRVPENREDGWMEAVINKSPDAKFTKCPSSTMSRFEEVVELQRHKAFGIKCDIETKMLSPDTAYACYLVFQLPENSEGLKCPVKARDLLKKNNKEDIVIYLRAPAPIDLYRDKRVPENREDGWMEVRVWKFVYNNEIKDNYIPMELKLVCLGGTMAGLTVCGIEFRPLCCTETPPGCRLLCRKRFRKRETARNALKRARNISGKKETFHVDWKHEVLSRKRFGNVYGPFKRVSVHRWCRKKRPCIR